MKKYILLLLILSISQVLVAQKLWESKNNNTAGLKLLSPDGKILIQESTKLTCLSNVDGTKLWEIKTAKDAEIKFIGIDNLALTTFSTSEIINIKDGSSVKLGDQKYTITSYENILGLEFIWASNANKTDLILINQPSYPLKLVPISDSQQELLNISIDNGIAYFFMNNGYAKIDLKSAKLNAFISIEKPKNLGSKLFEKYIDNKVVKLENDDILMHNGHLIRYNDDAKVLWDKELSSLNGDFTINENNEIIYGGKNKSSNNLEFFIFDANGSTTLSKEYAKKNLGALEVYNGKLFVITKNSSGFGIIDLYNAKDLQLVSENVYKTGIQNAKFIKKGNLLGYTNDYYTYYFDPKALDSKDRLINPKLFNYSSVQLGDKVYYYNSGVIKEQDLKLFSTKDLSPSNFSIKTVENDRINMVLDDSCLVLSGNQSLARISLKGEVIYNLYFPPPGESAGKIIGKTLVAAASAYAQVESQRNSQMASSLSDKQYWNNMRDSYAQLGKTYDLDVTKRFSKTIDDINNITMVTKDKESNEFKIIKVNKRDGKITGELIIKDRQPDYIFDPIESVIFYFTGNTITSYKI